MSPNEEAARLRAAAVRERTELGVAPVSELDELLPGDLVVRELPAGLDAVVARDPGTGATIVVAGTTNLPYRQRLSIAHELGHLEFDELTALTACRFGTANSPSETRANAFARHLLAPLEGVRGLMERRGTLVGRVLEADISEVVRHFEVSPQVAAIQLKELGWITPAEFSTMSLRTARELAILNGWIDKYKADANRSQEPVAPRLLVAAVMQAFAEGKTTESAVARALGKDLGTVRTELAEIHGTRPPVPLTPSPQFFDPDAPSR